jgi:hypothetical protein
MLPSVRERLRTRRWLLKEIKDKPLFSYSIVIGNRTVPIEKNPESLFLVNRFNKYKGKIEKMQPIAIFFEKKGIFDFQAMKKLLA